MDNETVAVAPFLTLSFHFRNASESPFCKTSFDSRKGHDYMFFMFFWGGMHFGS